MFSSLVLATWLLAATDERAPLPHRTSFAPYATEGVRECLRDVRREPSALLPYARLLGRVLVPGTRAEAIAALERLAAAPRTASRAQLYLGIGRFKLGQRREAEAMLRRAVERLHTEGEAVGEIYGRLYLETILRLDGRRQDAAFELRRAQELAARVADPLLSAMVQVFEAWEAFSNHDHGRALTLFESARDVLASGPNGFVESLAWEGIAAVQIQLYRHREALEAEKARIAAVERERAPTAWPRAALANRAFYMADDGGLPWEEVDQFIAEALEDASRSQSAIALRAAKYLRALRLGATPEAERMFEDLLRAREASHERYEAISDTWHLGRLRGWLYPERRVEAEELVTRAYHRAEEANLWDETSFALIARALLRWEGGNEGGARADTEEALRLYEQERDRQFEDSTRIGSGARAFEVYVDLSNPLLARGYHQEAFDLTERMRARSLLDAIQRNRDPAALAPVLRERRKELFAQLAALQSELLRSNLPTEARDARKRELGRVELQERQLADEIAHALAAVRVPTAPMRLGEIQRRMGSDEAMLSYVVAPEGHADRGDFLPGPRSFLLVVTARDVRWVRILDRDALDDQLRMFLAVVEGRGGVEAAGSVVLYRELLAEAVEQLDPGVRRLIVIPSGPLHGLPFELLRSSTESPPLGERFAIVRAPSATLWAYLRERERSTGREPLMALADPGALTGDRPALRRAAPWIEGLRLGALPFARIEAEHAVKALGSGSRLLAGPEASEHALKTLPLKQWSVLHVAAHAVVDEEYPERSAVVLTPGSPDEDGLLQARDIVDLDLDGMLVVLAACRTASGRSSTAEGPVGLTRAFLQAGARAVVVSLWELDDAASHRLFEHFYARLAKGDSVQEALRSAREARIAARDPSADWAGLVVVGDGDFRLKPATREGRPLIAVLVTVAALAAALALWLRGPPRWRRATAHG